MTRGDYLSRYDDSNKRRNNDYRDRSVPADENYYKNYDLDYNARRSSDAQVRDNQGSMNINDYIDSFTAQPPRPLSENEVYDPRTGKIYRKKQSYDLDSMQRERQPHQYQQDNRRYRQDERGAGRTSSRSGSSRKNGKKPKMSRLKKKVIAVLAVILAVILLISGLMNIFLGKITYDEHIDNQYISAGELKKDPLIKNVLLLGVDARDEEDDKKSRSDSMMIISVDFRHHCIKTVSLLRDSWVYIPCHNGEQRLNAACTYGGYSGVVDTVEYNFGIDINGYVVADFSMFQTLVDSIGGVTVEVTEKEAKEVTKHKKRYGNVKLEAGKQKLTGEQALAYCRIRKIDSDFGRTQRQRTVIKSVISGFKKAPHRIFSAVKGAAPYIETDLTKSQLKLIGFMAMPSISKMFEAQVPFDGTWQYANIGGASVISINKDENKDKLIDFIYNKTAAELKAEQQAETDE